MTLYTTSCKPLPFYADGEPPLEELTDKFGSHLEGLLTYEKLILLALIATNLAYHEATDEPWTLTETYHDLPSGSVSDELFEVLPSLDNLQRDSLLGLCEALVAQIRYTREVG